MHSDVITCLRSSQYSILPHQTLRAVSARCKGRSLLGFQFLELDDTDNMHTYGHNYKATLRTA